MHLHEKQIRLSASDLARHLGCRHLTLLDREAARGELKRPQWKDQALEILQQRGLIHEKAYLETLRAQGLQIVEIQAAEGEPASAAAKTLQAMKDGADVIVQAVLEDDAWYGRADILRRVERTDAGAANPGTVGSSARSSAADSGGSTEPAAAGPNSRSGDPPAARSQLDLFGSPAPEPSPSPDPAEPVPMVTGGRRPPSPHDNRNGEVGGGGAVSRLGDYSYEVYDTKLATETRGGTILQLCLYSDLVQRIQGVWPEKMYVVSPGEDFPTHEYRLHDFLAYYRLVRGRLLAAVDAKQGLESIYPEPVNQCDICVWWKRCDERRRDDDHLSLVAGMQSLHTRELQRQGVATLEGFAETGLPEKPKRGAAATFDRLRKQAQIQFLARKDDKPRYEILPVEEKMGLNRLPAPDPADIYFDIEGDRFLDDGGREYLLGYAYRDGDGPLQYTALWGLDRVAERRAFETLVDFVLKRWKKHPGMHVYHFAPYEPAALKRMMGRHASREDDIDRLLRSERFVDLFDIARHGVRASVESYSIKELETFTGYERETDLRQAVRGLRAVSLALALNATEDLTDDIRGTIESYNRDDCLSTEALQRWLEKIRQEAIDGGATVERPEETTGEASEKIDERRKHVQAIYDRLIGEPPDGLPEDPADWNEEESARWMMAQLLDYFRREEKGTWWEFFRMQELSDEDLLDERTAISGLRFVEEVVGGTARCPVHRYRFPAQETKLRPGKELQEPRGGKIGTVEALDGAARTVDIKKAGSAAARHPVAVFQNDHVSAKPLENSLLQVADWASKNGIDAPGPFRAGRDLLLRLPPRRRVSGDGPLRQPGENVVDAARRLALELDQGVLPVQGPPGSGKTYTGARIILSLLKEGRSVGVTAVSHKVIRNLLTKTLEAAEDEGQEIRCVHKNSDDKKDLPPGLTLASNNDQALGAIGPETAVGGTAWLWSRDDAAGCLDTLIVDEAGQMSLAQVLAVSRAARNIILLGDPQQLQQPQQGTHPDGADAAALLHILGDAKTIADDRGLFLDETWRLAPPIASFTSELYYEGRLAAHEGLEQQAILGDSPFAGSGLFVVPVEHEGNQSSSPEEVDAIERIVAGLLGSELTWRDREGEVHPLTTDDILVVSPYNAQVFALQERLPELRVGTVDRFQGQEAPVVIYSMAVSAPEEAPRGMSFLYEPNRFNVATSRAKCAVILVANPRLFEPDCQSVAQMRMANGVARFVELGELGELGSLEKARG